ncbi:MAG: serine protein kinase RIO, partial [Micromonosporaceae bacterium]
MRERDSYPISRRPGKQRWDDDDETRQSRTAKRLPAEDLHDAVDGLPSGDRWSVWDVSTAGERGPEPHPSWLITDLGAVDTELGMLKTGKEADVILLERAVPGTDRACLLASKRYRSSEHRMFHRDSGYLEGRRTRRSRDARAVAKRTQYGRQAIAGQWANAEFAALCLLHQNGAPVPYPVQIIGTELLLEFIGDPDGSAAPRLAQLRPDPGELTDLWEQLVQALVTLAQLGLAHGDLSPYNILVDHGRLVLIDVPQIVDVVANPQGPTFLDRDAT